MSEDDKRKSKLKTLISKESIRVGSLVPFASEAKKIDLLLGLSLLSQALNLSDQDDPTIQTQAYKLLALARRTLKS